MALRQKGALDHEAARAQLSSAGWSILTNGTAAPGAGAAAGYTVQDIRTRRVAVVFTGSFLDIRVDTNATATATDFPLIPNQYVVIDAAKDSIISFYNTTGGSLTVYCAELE